MLKMYNETRESFCINFGGENEIEVEELSEFLRQTNDILGIITSFKEPNGFYKLKVKAFTKGSFEINLDAITQITPVIYGVTFHAGTLVKTYLEITKFIKELKGKAPQKMETNGKNVNVTNYNGEVNTYNAENIFIVHNSPEIVDKVRKSFEAIENRTNVKYKFKDGELALNREELEEVKQLKSMEFDTETLKEQTDVSKRSLIVKKPDLNMKSKWEFVSDKIIKAKILDEEFKEYVTTGQFHAYHGQKLLVDLESKVKYDDNFNIIDAEYNILKVYLENQENGKLF